MKTLVVPVILITLFLMCCAAPAQPSATPITAPAATPPATVQPEKPLQPAIEDADAAGAFPITVTDGLSRKVTIKTLPRKIVSLAPSNTEILFALGLDDRIIGVTDYCNYTEQARVKPHVAGYMTPDLERLVTLSSDLVLAESIHEKTVLPALESRGFTVIMLQSHSIEEILGNIKLVGTVAGKGKNADKLVADLSGRISSVVERTRSVPQSKRPRVLYVIWNEPVWTMGGNTYTDDVISKAGGRNIFSADFEKSRVVSPESIVSRNPQVVIVSGMGTSGDTIAQNLRKQPWMQTTDAVRQGRVYVISNSDIIERPGPRIVQGLEEVGRLLQDGK